ncbi:hypothetical protein A3K55_01200 [Candidatus Shapirobacteria bacterium RBG_13_44_7]|uniref:Uncharacterized protein n=1 Tax=Candidatus Shapirobacteria bacterium RBG_13_44_7 TaxID=1802149 RepID=A0A1F7SH50_9BACT|nr:MAG: hypothetical protein A3K55_01200 [Candidatus Shapirobacteria bacterium RBG_13_44_7]
MNQIQTWIVLTYGLLTVLIFIWGFYESIIKKNPFRETPYLFWAGIFVSGDTLTLGLFSIFFSFLSFYLKDWLLFLLTLSVFWTVRSLGETIYWLNQQFSSMIRNPPERLRGYRLLKNDSIWFVYQNFWQCLTVIFVIATIYLTNLWLKDF